MRGARATRSTVRVHGVSSPPMNAPVATTGEAAPASHRPPRLVEVIDMHWRDETDAEGLQRAYRSLYPALVALYNAQHLIAFAPGHAAPVQAIVRDFLAAITPALALAYTTRNTAVARMIEQQPERFEIFEDPATGALSFRPRPAST